jgi:pSer/pThr/pTyr-binding forkhead associated (FHA) protein
VSHKLLVKDEQGEREVLLIDAVTVGRDPRCDISLADPLLSRRHAEFVASGDGVTVRDLNSRNGILVNGRKLPEALLRPGDVVQISRMAVTFLSSIDAVTVAAPRPARRHLDDRGNATNAAGPDDEKTSVLTPTEIEAVAAASAARPPQAVDAGAPGHGAGAHNGTVSSDGTVSNPGSVSGNGTVAVNGSKRAGAWSVKAPADDDRTKIAQQQPTTVSGDGDAAPADGHVGAALPGPAPVAAPPGEGSDPSRAAALTAGRQAVSGAGTVPTAGIAACVLALAAFCFAAGVASTVAWLGPPLTWHWLVDGHLPVVVLVSFGLAVCAGVVVVVALRNAVRRAEPGRGSPWRTSRRRTEGDDAPGRHGAKTGNLGNL